MNLLQETIEDIASFKLNIEDIIFIGSCTSGHQCTWREYCKLADVDYDDGFGAQEVASDLVIVFENGEIMERYAHDGSEQWIVSRPFVRPLSSAPIYALVSPKDKIGWLTLEDINH